MTDASSVPRREVLHFADQAGAAARFAAAAGLPCRAIESRRFPDGETLLRVPAPLAPRTLLFCTLGDPDARLLELMLAARAAREHGAVHLSLVAPYLCYMRQDRAFRAGEAVSQRIVGTFLAQLFDAVVTVDPHLHRIGRLEQVVPASPAVALAAAREIGAFVARERPDAILVGPDEESARWVGPTAAHAGRPHAVFVKRRHGDREVDVFADAGPSGRRPDLAGRPVVLVDDIASSGRTLAQAARVCLAMGASGVDAVVTHALCAGDDLAVLREAGVGRLWSTDSLPHPSNAIGLSALLAEGCRAHGLA
ncbi:MAG TPA: ribose-phosphate diphosphokinase [Burkholderiaceae bacterium]|nr:ribose-phosphate diphosphokinase [Burkholderiaceae bacterium]